VQWAALPPAAACLTGMGGLGGSLGFYL